MISGEPGRSLSLGVVRSAMARSMWQDRRGEIGLARGRGENARQREREMYTERDASDRRREKKRIK